MRARIEVGDVAHDLIENGIVQVVEKAADSVGEYSQREQFDLKDYKSHPLLGVTDEEPVWRCVYLPDTPTTSFSRAYDFPDSRLVRVPAEEASPNTHRVQDEYLIQVLTALAERVRAADAAEHGRPNTFEEAIRFRWPDDSRELLDIAFEITDAGQNAPRARGQR